MRSMQKVKGSTVPTNRGVASSLWSFSFVFVRQVGYVALACCACTRVVDALQRACAMQYVAG